MFDFIMATALDVAVMVGIIMLIGLGLMLRRDGGSRSGPHHDSPYRAYEDTADNGSNVIHEAPTSGACC
jgi:hypothetical protein